MLIWAKKKLEPYVILHAKINSRWLQQSNAKHKIIKQKKSPENSFLTSEQEDQEQDQEERQKEIVGKI